MRAVGVVVVQVVVYALSARGDLRDPDVSILPGSPAAVVQRARGRRGAGADAVMLDPVVIDNGAEVEARAVVADHHRLEPPARQRGSCATRA